MTTATATTDAQPRARRGRPARFESRKALIVRQAAQIINRRGVASMTLGEVAASLDMVPTAVAYYFRRKEDLAAACFLQSIARFDALIDEAEGQGDARLRLARLLQAFAQFRADVDSGLEAPVAIVDEVRSISDPEVNAAYKAMFRRARASFSTFEPNETTKLQRNAQTHLLISQLHWAAYWLSGYNPTDYGRMMERVCDLFLHGLAGPGATWAPKPLPSQEAATNAEGASREAFLRAATRLINEKGYKAASVKEISAQLNVTRGSFYHYNQTKDEIVGPCFERTFEILLAEQRAADAATLNGYDNLASLATSLVRRNVEGVAPLLQTTALTSLPEVVQTGVLGRYARVTHRYGSVICDGLADSSMRAVEVNVAAHMITGLINASAELAAWSPGSTAANAEAVFVRPFFEGAFG